MTGSLSLGLSVVVKMSECEEVLMQDWLCCLKSGLPHPHIYSPQRLFHSIPVFYILKCVKIQAPASEQDSVCTKDQTHAGGSHLEKWDLNSSFHAFKRRQTYETVQTERMENPQGKPVGQEWQTDAAFSGLVIVISHYCCLLQQQTSCSGWSCLCKLIFFPQL